MAIGVYFGVDRVLGGQIISCVPVKVATPNPDGTWKLTLDFSNPPSYGHNFPSTIDSSVQVPVNPGLPGQWYHF